MKTKKLLALVLSMAMVLAMLPFASLGVFALNVTDKVSEVTLTIPEPKAGNTVNLSYSSVEVKHHMTYKVVGLRWYKDSDNRQMGVESGADTYFIGGHSYTVEIDLAVKSANSGWNLEYSGYDTDYSGIQATVNGQTATVKTPPMNADQLKTITVSYAFQYIEDGVVKAPGVTIPAPIAGNKQPSREDVKVGNERTMWIPSSEYFWYVYDTNSWRLMKDNETFVAGMRYKVAISIQTNEGFVFDVDGAYEVVGSGDKVITGYVNGKQISMTLQNDSKVSFVYEYVSCEAQTLESVSFEDVQAPTATQHPQYNAPQMGDDTYSLLIDDEYTGGAKYNFVNGVQWNSMNGFLNEDFVFEEGEVYIMSFFIKTIDTHKFSDWMEASADVGYVDVLTMFDDPTIALVTITFAPCSGGALNEISVSGVKEPVMGETPDYDFIYGQGYGVGGFDGDIVWYDLTANRAMSATDTFVYGHEYELLMVLKSDKQNGSGDFEFAAHNALTVNINGVQADNIGKFHDNPEWAYVQAYKTFNCQRAAIAQVGVTVENPLEENHPAKQIGKGADSYKIEKFVFTDLEAGIDLTEEDVFEGCKNYTISVLLSAAEGYKFDETTAAAINGQVVSVVELTEDLMLISLNLLSDELPYFIISFSAGEGSGDMMSDLKVKGGSITLPECEYEAPEGKKFAGWTTDYGFTLLMGDYFITESVSFEAYYVYEDEHQHVYSNGYAWSDETFHYAQCMDEECPDNIYEMHDYGNNTNCDDTCTVCGYIRTVNQGGEPLHFYGYACVDVCPNCGLAREAEPHTPGEEATCTEAQKCTVCSKVLEPAKGHTPGEEADCGNAQTCTVCGATVAEATGIHTPGEAATCNKAQICTVCGATVAEATGIHTPGEAATCTKAQTCTVCGAEVSPVSDKHTPGAEATCTEAQKCLACEKELAPAKGHEAGVEWMQDEISHWHICAACGEKADLAEHTDTDENGKCDVCAYSETVNGGSENNGDNENDAPVSDEAGLAGWAIALIVVGSVLVLGGAGFCVYWFVIRKKKLNA